MDLNFGKMNEPVPTIIRGNDTHKVLTPSFINKEIYEKIIEAGKVTFFSRTKNRLWVRDEKSGSFLNVISIKEDCDEDTLLVQVNPVGSVCHAGTDTCQGEKSEEPVMFLKLLRDSIDRRHEEVPEESYTTSLFGFGINKVAQRVGEETAETVIGITNGANDHLIYGDSGLIYHPIVLLTSKGYRIKNLACELQIRHSDSWTKR